MTEILVCPWAEVDVHVEDHGVTHVVSLLGVEGIPSTPPGVEADNHLHIEVDDIAGRIGGYIAPDRDHVDLLLEFVRDWDRQSSMLVHCFAGISRSTAAALITMAVFNPGREFEAARLLRQRAPHAQPNRRMVALADAMLSLDGQLIAAVEAIGPRDQSVNMGRLVQLPAFLP